MREIKKQEYCFFSQKADDNRRKFYFILRNKNTRVILFRLLKRSANIKLIDLILQVQGINSKLQLQTCHVSRIVQKYYRL